MRQKRRYILVRILPAGTHPDSKQLYLAIHEAATSLFGDAAIGLAAPAVVFCDGEYAVVRCLRGTEQDLATALATVTFIGDRRIALRTLATSGTISAMKRRMKPVCQTGEASEILLGEKYFTAYHYPCQKVDLIEKSNKHQKLLFFTETDMEER